VSAVAVRAWPTPFFERDGCALYLGDCRELLAVLSSESVDLVVTDPPYGIGARPSGMRVRALAIDSIANDDSTVVGYAGLTAARRVLRPSRHLYTFGPFDLSRAGSFGARVDLVWDKAMHGMGNLALPWGPSHEPIHFGVRGEGKQNEAKHGGLLARRRGTVLRYPRASTSAVRWVGEKPVALLRELIEVSSRSGEIVLDPFAGSGSTLVAALVEGRRAIGIELSPKACEIAAERLRTTVVARPS
jgi:site-specific DNA-methyltransferase (adenine-specific)